jgi:hypothetical protein
MWLYPRTELPGPASIKFIEAWPAWLQILALFGVVLLLTLLVPWLYKWIRVIAIPFMATTRMASIISRPMAALTDPLSGKATVRDQLGVFKPLFGPDNKYLYLLNLREYAPKPPVLSPKYRHAVSLVVECCRKSENPYQEIGRLLDGLNWRPHLVAAVALSASSCDERAFVKLWAAFDSGSWVSPQLAVAAYLRDPNFCNRARARIESLCPVNASQLISTSPLERHVSAGPAGVVHRSAKAAASLVHLVSHRENEWLTSALSSAELAALLSEDRDYSAQIAQNWLDTLTAILADLNIPIS